MVPQVSRARVHIDEMEIPQVSTMNCSTQQPCDAGGRVECPTCGSELLRIANAAREQDGEEEENEEPDPSPPPTAATKSKAVEKPKTARKKPEPRGLKRFKPGVTSVKEVRKAIRVEMLACIPGWNRTKARCVIDAHPTGTLGEIMGSTLGQLARVQISQSTTLGTELAQALLFVVE